jgi:hypothetical protein
MLLKRIAVERNFQKVADEPVFSSVGAFQELFDSYAALRLLSGKNVDKTSPVLHVYIPEMASSIKKHGTA